MTPGGQYFRVGVGAVILSPTGHVLALERSDFRGSWQLPQGGLEEGEEPDEAILREIREETGLTSEHLTSLGRFPELTAYELPPLARSPKTGRGQVQYWFYFLLVGPDHLVRLPEGGEFRNWRWDDFEQLTEHSVAFRRPVYTRLERYWRDQIAPLIAAPASERGG